MRNFRRGLAMMRVDNEDEKKKYFHYEFHGNLV